MEKKIGLLIKEEFDRQGHSIGWLSRRLACDRSNVYRLFQRESIDTETLKRLCRILDHDFSAIFRVRCTKIRNASSGQSVRPALSAESNAAKCKGSAPHRALPLQ